MKNKDRVFKDWGERYDYGYVEGRKGRNVLGGTYKSNSSVKSKISHKSRFIATIKRVPEVIVKISGGGKNIKAIKAHFDYISRNGGLDIEDEYGNLYRGKDDMDYLIDTWKGSGIPYKEGTRKEAFNIILSMPAGTDRPSVKEAAREYASDNFNNHQYVLAEHTDEEHVHLHLCVKALDKDGIRLNPRKRDLQNWRESFVEKLRDNGIEANATRAIQRGVKLRSIRQSKWHSKAKTSNKINNLMLESKYLPIANEYGRIARNLITGDRADKTLALDIVKFVSKFPVSNILNKNIHKDVDMERESKRSTLSKTILEK